jgi:predicted P-loop ATPase
VQEELADIWIHEIADLSGLNRAEVEHVKAFASRTNDRARGAYARHLTDQPRQSIEVGTTNADSYLLSTTGNRRFWPFRMTARVEMARLRADRLQIWGEAAAAESVGETLVLAERLWGLAGDAQEARRAVDPWEDELGNLVPMTGVAPVGCERIEDWNGEQFVSNLSVHEYLAGYRRQTFHSGSGRKIAEIMRKLGWERCSRKMNGAAVRGYKRNAPSVTVTKSATANPF